MIRHACATAAKTCIAVHYELYQTFVALLGMVAVIHILCDFAWPRALGYGAITVGSYWVGQGIVTLFQRPTRRSNPFSSE